MTLHYIPSPFSDRHHIEINPNLLPAHLTIFSLKRQYLSFGYFSQSPIPSSCLIKNDKQGKDGLQIFYIQNSINPLPDGKKLI